MPENVDSTITAVTVYPDRARLVRRAEVELTADDRRLVVGGLPLGLDRGSVRARGRGAAGVRILGVDVSHEYHTDAPSQRVRELEEQIEAGEDEIAAIDDGRQGLDAETSYLAGLRESTREYARALAWGKMTVEEQASLGRFLADGDTGLRERRRELERERRVIERRLAKLRAELQELKSARPRARHQAVVEIEVTSPGDFALELEYVVPQAAWRPLYDVRLAGEAASQRLELTYLAEITQRTGEDWMGASLSVSTARPALNQRAPELHPWYLQPRPEVRARARQVPMAMAAAAPPAAPAEMAGAAAEAPMEAMLEELADAEVVTSTVRGGDVAVTFDVPGAAEIPSDGTAHKVTLTRVELDPELDYLSVPKHTDAVYRRVRATNDGPAPLLDGPASLFVGDEYIGQAGIEHAPRGARIELLLGVEDGISVERELKRHDVDKKLLRDRRKIRQGFAIELDNHLDVEARVLVEDHVPVSRHEDIQVELDRVEPAPSERSDLNLLEWSVVVPGGEKRRITYEFVVEHPRDMKLQGLD